MHSLAIRLLGCCALAAAAASSAYGQVNVTMQRYDNARTGQNLSETTLNTSNVGQATFGKLFTRAVDDEVYAQPLYVSGVNVPGVGVRNVLYVATLNNTLYAFDADNPGAAAPLWRMNFNYTGRAVNNEDVGQNCGTYRDFSGQIGIVGTPVIDATAGTLWVVSRTVEGASFVQRLHAINIATGAERAGSPVVIQATAPGTGAGSSGGQIAFNPKTQNQRGALVLANNMLYITWASHCDTGPYHGWLMGFNPSTLALVFARNVTPDGQDGGIWQSGTGPSVDASGNLYLTVGNGTVSTPNGSDYGNAFMKFSPSGAVMDWFIPFNWQQLNNGDIDLGSAGILLIPGTNLLTSGGKEGKLYLLDRDNLGHFHAGADTQIVQSFQVASAGRHFHGTPSYWNGPGGPFVYTWCEADRGKAFRLSGGLLTASPVMQTTAVANDGMPGGMMTVSANGNTAGTGILWAALALSGDANQMVRPGILRAYDAADLTHELWNSQMNAARDDFGNFAKFNHATVVNGKVYLPTFSRQIVVYGLLPAGGGTRPTVSAGADQSIALPNSATLAGSASDDGLPSPLTTQWVQVSGPGPVTFGNANALSTTATFSVPGSYALRLTASDGALAADAMTTVTVLAQGAVIGTGTGIKGEYYNNQDFTGTLVTRTDDTIGFDWGEGAPIAGINPNTFSVRWTGFVQAQFTETYTFTTRSDDGVRLWVNNQQLVDNWTDHGATDNSGTISLVKGQRYAVRMEYYDASGGAVAMLSWSSPSTPKTIVPRVQLFPQAPPTTGSTTVAAYVASSGAWFLRNANSAGSASLTFAYGPSGQNWTPLAGDWNGDGVDTPGLYDPATGTFYLRNANAPGNADLVFTFGAGGGANVPIVGDWDGNGTDTIGLYTPATGAIFLKNANSSGNADVVFSFGAGGGGFVPLAGDWDGDGRDTVGLYAPASGAFFLRNANAAGSAEWVFTFGPTNVTPVAGDWDGDGIDSVGVYVPSTGAWFLRNTNTFGSANLVFSYGPTGVRPVVGNWDGQ